MAKTYEEYREEELKKAQQTGNAFAEQRRTQADEAIRQSNAFYENLTQTAQKEAQAAVDTTESGYRDVYDANAVNELVARRHVEEAMANMGLTNSGLNRTQQTAISLSRGRADSEATRQKQAAVDAIMRELDNVRAQYATQKETAAFNIDKQAESEIRAYRQNLDAAVVQNAVSQYAAIQQAETDRLKLEQDALDKQAQYQLDMLKLGYEYDAEKDMFVKPAEQTNGLTDAHGLTDEQIRIAVEYANENGMKYAEAVKEIFGVTAGNGVSLYDTLKEFWGTEAGAKIKRVNAVKSRILGPIGYKTYKSGDYSTTYPKYVVKIIEDAHKNNELTTEEALDLIEEYEAKHGGDWGQYISSFGGE